MIKPTVGRVVWYHPQMNDPMGQPVGDGPHAALIAHVWSDTCVNLAIFDSNGTPYNRRSVFLYQGEGDRPDRNFCEWVPYQVSKEAIDMTAYKLQQVTGAESVDILKKPAIPGKE